MPKINNEVLMSGADYFSDNDAINVLMDASISVNVKAAIKEHESIKHAFIRAGIKVYQAKPPEGCQDGIYTANWGLIKDGKVVLARLPNKRRPEEPYAKQILKAQGLIVLELPQEIKAFSGQGDAIAAGETIFMQSPYRTQLEAHKIVKELLGFKEVVSLQTKPARWFKFGPAKRNKLTGWLDSPTYDVDLAIAYLRPASENQKALIAYCPAVFKRRSRKLISSLSDFDKIIVTKDEALSAYATNLVSTGDHVIMNTGAPKFKAELISRGLKVTELSLPELKKGGGSIRCCSLTLS